MFLANIHAVRKQMSIAGKKYSLRLVNGISNRIYSGRSLVGIAQVIKEAKWPLRCFHNQCISRLFDRLAKGCDLGRFPGVEANRYALLGSQEMETTNDFAFINHLPLFLFFYPYSMKKSFAIFGQIASKAKYW